MDDIPIHDTTNQQRYKKSRTAKRQSVQERNKVLMDGIHLAIHGRHWEVVEELLPYVDINQVWRRGVVGKSILGYACENFGVDKIQFLVERGADVNGGDYTLPPLLSAHNEQVVEYLLRKGADVNNLRDPATSPLYLACIEENKNHIKKMIKYGRPDDSLLFIARDEVVEKRLILLGANVNALNSSMKTPLSWAIENRKSEAYFFYVYYYYYYLFFNNYPSIAYYYLDGRNAGTVWGKR
jgi:ankyrin repeat protein